LGYTLTILIIKSLKNIEGNIFPVKKASMHSKGSGDVIPISSPSFLWWQRSQYIWTNVFLV